MTSGTTGHPAAIGGHAVEALIGSGGQAEVFALAPVPGRPPLALKWSRQSFAPRWADPLAAEYRALSRLCHPQLPAAYDFGYHEGRAYLVLERVGGPELFGGLGRDKRLALAELVRAVSPVLSFLHRRGIIHRDLKPANFRWSSAAGSPSRRLCLLDLGLVSRPRDPANEGRAGTLCYMAPEVLKEGRADPRSDLYSLGVILYEWLTGAPPFTGDDPAEVINGHLTGKVHWPDQAVADVGGEVATVISGLLEKEPKRRPESVEDLCIRFAQAGLLVDPGLIATANLPWHRQTTLHDSADIEIPVDLTSHLTKPVTILLAGDPGSGTAGVLRRWEQECKIHGWSVDCSEERICAAQADTKPSSLTVLTGNDPTTSAGWEVNARDCRWLALRPMGEAEVAQYLGNVFFDEAGVRELTAVAMRLSSGLPEALDVLIGEWTAGGAVHWSGDTWAIDNARLAEAKTCGKLQHLYRLALGEVSADQIRALNAASVFGREISIPVLGEVLDSEGIDRQGLDELAARGVFAGWADPEEPVIDARFRLSGLSAVWEADLPPDHRRRLHAAIAAALEKRQDVWGERIFRRLAHHYQESFAYRLAGEAALRWAEFNTTAEHAEEAHRYLDLALVAAEHLQSAPEQNPIHARIAFLRGRTDQASGRIEEAQRSFRRVLALTRHGDGLRLAAEAAKHLGDAYKSTRRHAKGERILRIALRQFRRLGDDAEISHTLNNLGNIAWVRGEIDRGLEYYHHALDLQRRLGRTGDVASTLSNIGAMYLGKYDFGRAKACMEESLHLKESLGQSGEVARTLNNLGLVGLYAGEFDSAVDYLTRASVINEAEGMWDRWLLNRRNLLDARLSQSAYRRVVDEVPGLLRKAEELDEWVNRANVHLCAARAFHELADYRSSRLHLERAADVVDQVSDPTVSTQYFVLLAERRMRFGDCEGCLRALKAALEQANASSDLRDRAEVYLAAARLEHDTPELPPELYAAGAEAYRLFEKLGMGHRLFETVLIADDDSLTTFLTQFPLPENFVSDAGISYAGPPAQKGLWLWRLAKKALTERDHSLALRLLNALVAWCEAHGVRELAWRALTHQGMLYHQIHDWELAAHAFNAAVQTLEDVAATIELPTEREAYLSGEEIQGLNREVAAFSRRFATS